MRITKLIEKKKMGSELTREEINYIINAYMSGEIADYHMSALAMAICFRGMSDAEIGELTFAMADSGDKLDLSKLGDLSVDKHSTGGVGDKTTLVILPIVSALGAKVAKMSGRGLGHTGGTIDKLQAIPGFNCNLSNEEFLENIYNIGVALTGSTKYLAPGDKKLYALRDVTATVDSIPLIASSVMSKKIAAGAKNLVIDIKCGSGAFMKSYDEALTLAEKIVAIGKHCRRNISAVITNMDIPLGNAVGNSLEVREAIDILKGKGPADLREVCVILASEMLSLVFGGNWRSKVEDTIDSGKAYQQFEMWINTQNGNINALSCSSEFSLSVISPFNGYISHMDTKLIGEAAMILGAGRSKITDDIDPESGIVLSKKTGDKVISGEVLATLYTNKEHSLKSAKDIFISALNFSDTPPDKVNLIYRVIR